MMKRDLVDELYKIAYKRYRKNNECMAKSLSAETVYEEE